MGGCFPLCVPNKVSQRARPPAAAEAAATQLLFSRPGWLSPGLPVFQPCPPSSFWLIFPGRGLGCCSKNPLCRITGPALLANLLVGGGFSQRLSCPPPPPNPRTGAPMGAETLDLFRVSSSSGNLGLAICPLPQI